MRRTTLNRVALVVVIIIVVFAALATVLRIL
jgi:hypothetical protein